MCYDLQPPQVKFDSKINMNCVAINGVVRPEPSTISANLPIYIPILPGSWPQESLNDICIVGDILTLMPGPIP